MSHQDVEHVSELSPVQQAMLFHSVYSPGSGVYVVQVSLRLTGRLDVAAFTRAWRHVVERHGILRTAFYWEDLEKPMQVVYRQVDLPVHRGSWRDLDEEGQRARLQRWLDEDRERGFDLSEPPLLRLALFELGDGDHRFVWSQHHLLTDGWSLGVLLRELFAAYEAFAAAREPSLPRMRPYREYIAWLQRQDLGEAEAFWRRRLAGLDEPTSLTGGEGRAAGGFRESRRQARSLSPKTTEALRELARRHRLTLSTLVQGAWALLLARWTGRRNVVFGLVVAGRPAELPGVETMVGPFINTLPLRAGVAPELRLGEWLAALQESQTEMRRYDYAPLYEIQAWSGVPAGSGLFDSILAFENYPLDQAGSAVAGLAISEVSPSELTNFPVTLVVAPGERLTLELIHDTGRFDPRSAIRLLEHLAGLMERFAAHWETSLGNLPLLPEAERHQARAEWNDTQTAYPREASVPELFAAVVDMAPEAVSVVDEGEVWSYRGLDEASSRLAWRLLARGVGTETPVGVALDRSAALIVALLGILKAGGVYVPLDPAYPDERLAFMLADTAAPVTLVQGPSRERFERLAGPARLLELDGGEHPPDTSRPPVRVLPEELAYVLYTSGSTGRPKGVAVPHRAIVRLVRETNYVQLGPGDRVAHLSNTSFDAATFEVWGALLNGATVVIVPRQAALAREELAARLRRDGVSAMFLTAALFDQMALEEPRSFATVRHMLFGGEAADPAAVARVLAEGPPERLLNGYGPTESTTFATWHRVREVAPGAATVPIGLPLANTTAYVLDAGHELVPPGRAGELCLGGDGLARGYLNRPELTAERFIPDPLGGDPGARLYRTGDLVRQRGDGAIEFVGRLDQQVKIRGFRIEPGEIEAAIGSHPAVHQCVVLARRDRPGDARLVAYVVPAAGESPNAAALRDFVKSALPDYMLPSAFVFLAVLPLTPNGKLDRGALPAPEEAGPGRDGWVAPSGPVEGILAGIWAEVLGRERVGARDDFFELGGHSLLATQVVSRVRGVFQVELPLHRLFDEPTVEGLARAVGEELRRQGAAPAAPPIEPSPREGDPPLSFAQQRLWFLDQLEPGNPAYNVPWALRLQGELDLDLLRRCFHEVARRHETLRTTFASRDGVPVQVIGADAWPEPALVDLTGLAEPEREKRARWLAREEAARPFDLRRGPLLRLVLVRLEEQRHLLLLTLHHIVSDGWSLGILVREVAALYGAFSRGAASPLPELPAQYADFAVWQREWLRGEVLEAQLAYWRARLQAAPRRLELPADRPRTAAPVRRGAARPFALSEPLSLELAALSRSEGATPFMTLLAAFGVLLGRVAGQEDVLIGTPVANRNRREIEDLIGFFVNTLVLRVELAGTPSFRELLASVRQTALDAYAHQDLPFERLVEEVGQDRGRDGVSPLFQVMLVLQNAPLQELALPELTLSAVPPEPAVAKFDLILTLEETPRGLAGFLEYDAGLFDRTTVDRLAARFERLLAAATEDPDRGVAELPVLLGAERHQALLEWNDAATAYPREACLAELFERVAREHPEAPAVVGEAGEVWTYRALDEASNQLARRLRGLGVGPEVAVGISMERSPELILGTLAILKAGGVYAPLDPSYPDERLAFMLADTRAEVVLVHARTRERLQGLARVVDAGDPESEDAAPLGIRVAPECLAYVIYTSGSTGRPKGVAVPQRAVIRLVRETNFVRLGPGDRTGHVANISFDAATYEIWGALLTGGAVAVIPREVVLSPAELAAWIREREVTTMFLTSALFTKMSREVPGAFANMSALLVGGEAVDPTAARTVLAHRPPRALLNGYGPTESTTFAAWHAIREVPAGAAAVPIGLPLANTSLYVLDRGHGAVPPGTAGELCIGGDGLARGYLNRPELTAERFIPHPWARGERLYRTGDLVRQRPDGVVEYLGRLDDQVKIRGFRIEPGEIEAVLADHPGIRECAVLARRDTPGEIRLVAYAVGQEPRQLRVEELRRHLQGRLPEYMLPSAWVLLDALPLTANGKLDRRALPAPELAGSVAGEEPGAPADPVEELLAAVWSEVLGVPRIGIHDDFFSLGGHSLLATQVASRIRDVLGVELPLRRLFEASTIAELARLVREGRDGAQPGSPLSPIPPILPVPRTGDLPLSFAQQRLWFLDQLEPGNPAYNLPSAVRLSGEVSAADLSRIFGEIVRRHETLRTTFASRDGRPVQIIAAELVPGLPVVDLAGLPPGEREARARGLALAAARRPFDLARGPLLRLQLVRLAEREHLLLVTMHHIVSDGWSMGVLQREIASLFEARSQGRSAALPELPVQYADFAHWQRDWLRGEVLESQLAYWRRELDGAARVLELPADRPRPAVQTFAGSSLIVTLPPLLGGEVRGLCRREGVTPFMVLVAAWAAVLGRHANQEDVLLGSPVAGRNRREIEGLIGFFVNTLVMRADFSGAPSFAELLRRVRRAALDGYTHQDVPFERLVEELVSARDLARSPLFQVLLVLQNAPRRELAVPGLTLAPAAVDGGVAKFDLTLTFQEAAEARFDGVLEYSTDLYDRATVARLWARFQGLLEAAAGDPANAISDLPLLPAAERHQALVEWNDTVRPGWDGPCLHELIALQAEHTPDAVAASYEGRDLTYRELDRRANQLAHHLIALGAGLDDRVGVLLDRSLEMIVGLLGVLKAGAAYVPLDPTWPAERLALLVGSAGVRTVLAQAHLSELLPRRGETAVLLDEGWPEIAARPPEMPAVRASEDNLAYALFTSGSTGAPKGVMIPHRGIVNRLLWMQEAYGLSPEDRVLQKTPFSFDVSLWEFFWPLLAGARLVFARPEGHRDPEYLVDLIARERITTLHFVPSMLQVFLEAPGLSGLSSLRLVMASGEALPLELVRRFFSRIQGAELHNLYGPTEASVDVSFWACEPDPARPAVPIGRPISNLCLYVVDRDLRPQPTGVPGELLLGGVGLARGYLGRPDLTAASFVPDPFGGVAGGRLYRTGDLTRALPDGPIEFLGRIDHQVKIRGFRIELGEIEAALASRPGVRECVVVVRDGRLVAYLAGESLPEAGELREFLASLLPEYMVPAVYVPLERLPLSANGKVDRRALPEPERTRDAGVEPVAPRTRTEETLAEIWKELLGLDEVGVEDRFFDLGGHSLLAVQVLARVRQTFGVEVSLRDVFKSPTVAGLAQLVDAQAAEPTGEEELAALLDELDLLSDDEALARLEDLRLGGP